LNRHEQFPTVIDISSSHDLYFLTLAGGVNRRNEADSATTSEKQTLIFRQVETAAELDVLLPSILDHAFKGEI
jgi:hypothetical protein